MDRDEHSYEISGIVTGHAGAPLGGARVVVWWQQIRKRKELAACEASENGHYRVEYRIPQGAPQPVLLIVEALSEHLDAPLFSPLTPAQSSLDINLAFEPKDQSEWALLVRSIEPLAGGLTLDDLVESNAHRDLTFLARELNKSAETLMRVALSARLEAAFKIPAPAFYAFLRQQVPATLPTPLLDASQDFALIEALVQNVASMIFALSAQVQTQTLTAAIALDYIGPQFTGQLKTLTNQLQALRTTDLLNQPYLVGNASLATLLDVVAIPAAKQQTFAQLLAANIQSMRNFWRTLNQGKSGLTAEEASAIQRALSIGAFVKNYPPVVQALVQGFTSGTYQSLSDLARLSQADWIQLIAKSGAPASIDPAGTDNPEQVFAEVIYTRIIRAFPTVALTSRIAGGTFVPAAQQQPLVQFFQNNTGLELLKDNIAVYLAAKGDEAFGGINVTDRATVVANVRGFQRTLRVAPDADIAETLLGLGLSSATQIAALGKQQFINRAQSAGVTPGTADQIFDAASQRYTSVVSTFMQFNRGSLNLFPKGLGDLRDIDAPIEAAVQADASLVTLFGSQDYCDTADCASVLSPAAYLCDLLLWLRNHPQGAGTALDVLDSRRPDIRHLLLNCPNSDSELPFIDLIIELLADAVSPPAGTALAAAIGAADLVLTVTDASPFPAVPFTALIGAEIIAVTATAGVGNVTWTILRAQQGTTAAAAVAGAAVILTTAANPPWKQTPENATAEQLSAAPVYFNQDAFVILFDANYPQSLPYSAGLDELRTYLRQWNLPLWQLRQALLPVAGATGAQLAAVAGERLGMNAVAQNLITTANAVSAANAWNIAAPTTSLATVPAFLQAGSISYESLLELLDSAYVQGGLDVALFGLNDLCDTTTQSITPLTTLAVAITDVAAVSIAVADGRAFPAPPFDVAIGDEILQVNAVAGTNDINWTVVRGQLGTVAALAPLGANVCVPLDAGFLDRANRFLRLWNNIGYKIWELDLLLEAPKVGNGTLDQNALIALQAFWQLQNATKLSVDQQLSFYQDIDTATHRDPDGSTTTSLYSQIFLNPTTTWIAPDPDLANLPSGGAIGDPTLSHHVKAIQPALGMSAADLNLLLSLTDNSLSIANLSLIYRLNALATAAKLSVANLFNFAKLLTPAAAGPNTTLAAAITGTQTSLTVVSATNFGPANFYIEIGAEVLLVTGMSGAGNATWTVVRGQLGSAAAPALAAAPVTSDSASPAVALAALIGPASSPAASLTFLTQATAIQQQAGLTPDAINYLLTPPSSITEGWASASQMTPVDIAGTLSAVQKAVLSLLRASTTLAANIGAGDLSLTVASDANFPVPNFYVYIGAEIVLVTAVSDPGNKTWTVARGQLGTTAAAAAAGTTITPTAGDLSGVVIATVAANAHGAASTPLANDVTALILQTLQLPGSAVSLLSVLTDPSLLNATGTISITGSPAAGDSLQATLSNGIAAPVVVNYPLAAADVGSINQTAVDFAAAINASTAVAGPQAFLSLCAAANGTITLTPLNPGVSGSGVTLANVAAPGGVGHVTVTPAATQTIGLPAYQNQFTALQLFDKAAVLVRGLRLVAADLTWLLQTGGNAAVGGLNFAQLPVTTAQPALPLTSLLTTLLAIKLARLWKSAPPAAPVQLLYDIVADVIDGTLADEPSTQAALASITGWPLADIESFAATISLTFPASYTAPASYDALRTLEAMSAAVNASGPIASSVGTTLTAAIGVADLNISVASAIGFPAPNFYVNIGSEILRVSAFAGADNTTWTVQRAQQGTASAAAAIGAAVTPTYGAQIVSWASVPVDEVSAEAMAASALGILKAQQPSADAWTALAPTLMNPLRENQSAALQAFLVGQRTAAGNPVYPDADGQANTNGLFNYFLIDTQMTSCQVTSRVVQAYIAVQIFVERCLMNLEAPEVIVDLNTDDTWDQWEWMSRYRIWEANREVFLYPENWLIESQRPNRTEIFQKFEQDVRQNQSTADYLETVVLNYIDRLDGLAHLLVTGTCEDPATGTIYVVARTIADPPIFHSRTYTNGSWSGWTQILLDIKASQVVPAIYRGRLCLFWLDVKVTNEPQQQVGVAQPSSSPPSTGTAKYIAIGVFFSIFRNEAWAPAQAAKGTLFDKPFTAADEAFLPTYQWWLGLTTIENNPRTFENLYTIKLQSQPPASGYGTNLLVDIFRLGRYDVSGGGPNGGQIGWTPSVAVHVGRATFDGRFSDLELNNTIKFFTTTGTANLLTFAQSNYGPDALPLLPLTAPDPDLTGNAGLLPQAGAWTSQPVSSNGNPVPLNLALATTLEQNTGPLLDTAQIPFRVVGPDTDLSFNSASYFFFQDNRRSYFVTTQKDYQAGSAWSPVVPSYPSTVPYEVSYQFHPFYHPFTRLFWNQLSAGDFDLLYDANLQQAPDVVDPSHAEVFSFSNNYQPSAMVDWDHSDVATALAADIAAGDAGITVTNNVYVPTPILTTPAFYIHINSEILRVVSVGGPNNTSWGVLRAQQGTGAAPAKAGDLVTPTWASQDRQFLDFSTSGAFAVYNWELFYHVPLFVAQLLSQNQQFEDAQTWFHYIFNPTRQGSDPAPQRFWIPKPLHNLTSAEILAERINNLLIAVNTGDPTAKDEIEIWRSNPFNPFALADQRPIAYMKSTVMSYLDNLIAWGDNLFATQSREALSEATLLYVIASEVLGPTPTAVTPPQHADESFDELEPLLDDFANAMVEIENVIGGSGGGSSSSSSGGVIPPPQTFYFKIPSNPTLMNYWSTVADRLFKLRHCEDLAGAPLSLALFDAPIDPGLLVAAQAAGVDLSSVLSNLAAALPNYRFTTLYTQALDFVNAVRAYGSSLQAALEKSDAGALSLLQQTTQQQLLADGSQILDWQVQQAQNTIDALNQNLDLGQTKVNYYNAQSDMSSVINNAEKTGLALQSAALLVNSSVAVANLSASISYLIPYFTFGISGFGGTPDANSGTGGKDYGHSFMAGSQAVKAIADVLDKGGTLSNAVGKFLHTQDDLKEKATEAEKDVAHTQTQIAGAQFALRIAQQNQALHQEQVDNLQKQIDFLNDKFTSNGLYDWMVGSLSSTYFQSYQLAYQMCKQVERCYQFELGIRNSSFIQFGYWDSLYKGLLSGETLNHDLRRMQASYLQLNARRFELSRYVSLGMISPTALQQLLATGACDFTLPESLFDGDYPGHYNRRLTRVSVTVVYPSPGKFDNVKASLTLTANQVRISTETTAGYAEAPVGSDSRFIYTYAAVPQKVALGNAQDDPGLFITAIASNIVDQRYLPFENAGAISSWHFEMPAANNEIDISTVGDIVLHLYYTALDGGAPLQQTVLAYNQANLPAAGVKVFSAQNDFAAPAASAANPYPVSPWSSFLSKPLVTQTTLAWPITATQGTITVASNSGFPAVPFFVNIGEEIFQVTATGGTGNATWTVARAQQGSTAAAASTDAVVLLPAAAPNQILSLAIAASKFPAWTRGKTITVTSVTVLILSWQPTVAGPPGPFNLVPQAPFPNAPIDMLPLPGVTEPNVCSSGAIVPPAGTGLGSWTFEVQQQGAANFNSLSKNAIGDILLLVSFSAA